MDLHEVVLPRTSSQLAHRLDKGHALDIANGTTQLYYADIGLLARVIDRDACNPLDPLLDCICNVGDDLYGFTQVVALSLTLDNMLVDLARGNVVIAR